MSLVPRATDHCNLVNIGRLVFTCVRDPELGIF